MQNDVGKLVRYVKILRNEEYWMVKCEHHSLFSAFAKFMSLYYRRERQKWEADWGLLIPW